jgi:hypothetical protein
MKNNLLYKSLLFVGLGIAFIGFKSDINGKSGCSTSGCGSCHGSLATGTTMTLTGVPTSGYTPGSTYTMLLTLSNSSMTGGGFDLKTSAGTLVAGAGSKIKSTELVHSARQAMVGGVTAWTFTWTAPTTGVGNITMNVAGNAVNSNGGDDSGDKWNVASFTFVQNIPSSLTNTINNKIQINPNPCTNQITITDANALKNIQVLNLHGQNCNIPVAMQGSNAVLHIENLSTGLYILSAIENGVISTTKFYKN